MIGLRERESEQFDLPAKTVQLSDSLTQISGSTLIDSVVGGITVAMERDIAMDDLGSIDRATQLPGKALNVLVVDDSPTDLKLAVIYLGKAWPFNSVMAVETAADGLEALEKMRTKRFCLIILDWCLPKGGNGQVLREIRHNGVFIPVVISSGLTRDQLPDYLEAEGAAYLNKNELNAATLYCAIAEALRNCQVLRQSSNRVATTGAALSQSQSPLTQERKVF